MSGNCSRNFQLTLNECERYEALKAYLTSLKSNNYFIACKEKAPTTGHEHVHVYVQFDHSIRLAVSKTQGAHIEKCFGSPQQNIDYVKKDGDVLDEIGTVRLAGNPTIRDIKKMTPEEAEDLPWNMYHTVSAIKGKQANDIDLDDIFKPDMKVIWITGPSGVGKSRRAFEICRERGHRRINMVKFDGSFWHGVGTSEVAVYDDFRDSHMKPSEFINFIDYNVHPMNVKGGSELNRYRLIIVTSVQRPEHIYLSVGGEPRKQWIRRMEVIELSSDE